jgi:hypothetical protein
MWRLIGNSPTLPAALLSVALAGCGWAASERVYRDADGFRFRSPAGWSERARNESPVPDRLLVQYKRLRAGNPAWLSVSVAAAPRSVDLETWLARRALGPKHPRESTIDRLELGGQPAVRLICSTGRPKKREFVCEWVAVRRHDRVYIFHSSFTADDRAARDEVRQAVASVAW